MTNWRAMTEADLPAVQALADAAHPGLPERPEVLADKLRHFPGGCLVLAAGDAVAGYAFAHPWRQGSLPKLDAPIGALPPHADCLYVHDVVVAPAARGQGAAGTCIARLASLARTTGLPALTLVSVYDTWPMWQRHGFRVVDRPEMDAVLADYGPSARYMWRPS